MNQTALLLVSCGTAMRRDEAFGNAERVLHFRPDVAAVVQDFEICAGPIGTVRLEETNHHCRIQD